MSRTSFQQRLSRLLPNRLLRNGKGAFSEPHYLNFSQDISAFTAVFVGGAGRSGTTLVHSLICTSPAANPYVAECSYFADLLAALPHALASFNLHNRYYFSSPGELMQYHGKILKYVLVDFWHHFGKPELLVLKQPLMTRHFHFLAQILPNSRFVVMVRDPRDVIQSRLEVHYKMGMYSPEAVSTDDLDSICNEFNEYYDTLIKYPEYFGDRLLFVSYERLVAGEEAARIAAFLGVDALRPDLLWKRAVTEVGGANSDEWTTPLYGQEVTGASIGRYREMPPAILAQVVERCGATAEALNLRL